MTCMNRAPVSVVVILVKIRDLSAPVQVLIVAEEGVGAGGEQHVDDI